MCKHKTLNKKEIDLLSKVNAIDLAVYLHHLKIDDLHQYQLNLIRRTEEDLNQELYVYQK